MWYRVLAKSPGQKSAVAYSGSSRVFGIGTARHMIERMASHSSDGTELSIVPQLPDTTTVHEAIAQLKEHESDFELYVVIDHKAKRRQ